MSEEEKEVLKDHIVSMCTELNAQYPGCISDEELVNLTLGTMTMDIPLKEAMVVADEKISAKVASKVNSDKPVEEKGRLLTLTRDDGYILSNSVIIIITLLLAFLVIVVSVLLN